MRLELDTAWGRSARLTIEFIAADILRWTFVHTAKPAPRPTESLAPGQAFRPKPPRWQIRPEPNGLLVTGLRFGLRIGFSPPSIRLGDRRGAKGPEAGDRS